MTLSNLKHLYSHFLKGHEGKLHFAAHSHHFWPDVTRDAHLQYWDDCAHLSDKKWDKIFSEVIPKAQEHVAHLLHLKNKNQIVFAPNTHELTTRLLSLFLGKTDLKILTTESEFHSWKRQVLRLMELPEVQVTMVPFDSKEKLLADLKLELQKKPDVFYLSHVFFDSGIALSIDELSELEKAKDPATLMVVDGYHAFAAIPVNLSSLEGKIFYLGGGYKYAQAGEGVGFMVVPEGNWRPANTGWFAEYGELSRPKGSQVGYTQDAQAFVGATQDPSGLYRFNAVWDKFQELKITSLTIHERIQALQFKFLQGLSPEFLKKFGLIPLYKENLKDQGHFLTFKATSPPEAQALEETLKNQGIIIDRRGTNLRFGFGLYHDHGDVEKLTQTLNLM